MISASIFLHNAIAGVNTAALREEIYCCGGKQKKMKISTIPNPNPNFN